MKNIFIVGTPLQLLNAIEAIYHFDLKDNILVLIHRSMEVNRVQMQSIVSMHKWSEIIEIPYKSGSNLFSYIKIIRYLNYFTYNYMFVTKLEPIQKVFIANIHKKKVFLLDDGTLTISIYENQIKPNRVNKYSFKEIRFLLFGLKIKVNDAVNLFTYFDLEATDKIDIVKNRLNFLKTSYLGASLVDSERIYFLGQPSFKHISDSEYIDGIMNLTSLYNKKIVYIPHRGESVKSRTMLLDYNNSLIEILDINMPVELYFLENKIYPTHIISYYSTALVTLHLIYDQCKVDYIAIPNGDKINKDLIGVYKAYNEFGFGQLYLENVGSNA